MATTRSGKVRINVQSSPKSKKRKIQSTGLPEPHLQVLYHNLDKVYCDICNQSWSKKANKQRKHVTSIDRDKFKEAADVWKDYEHEFGEVFGKVDWSRNSFSSYGKCRRRFFDGRDQDSCRKIPHAATAECNMSDNLPSASASSETESEHTYEETVRRSSRKRNSYDSKGDAIAETTPCIICKTIKKDRKGRDIPVTLICVRPENEQDRPHLAAQTLIKFANIDVKHNTIYKEAAERILLQNTIKSLFVSDVAYHKEQCYIPFRHNKYLSLDKPGTPTVQPVQTQNSINALLELVRLHVICRKEVYALSDIRAAYESLKTPECPILRSCDIKEAINRKFPTEVVIDSSSYSSYSSKDREYVFPLSKSLTPDVMQAAASFGLSKSAVFRSAANRLHYELQKRQVKKKWPPTLQDILADKIHSV